MKQMAVSLLAVAVTVAGAAALEARGQKGTVELSDLDWKLQNSANGIDVKGKVPSLVHIDLHNAGIIDDPTYGDNDGKQNWIAYSDWTYVTKLPKLDKSKKTFLEFDGLDTFANIQLCGKHVSRTDNMFRQYAFDVSKIIESCDNNELRIAFSSAADEANRISAAKGTEHWPSGINVVEDIPNREYIRKEQSDFGWDWGPALGSAGIWKSGRVVQLDEGIHVQNTLVDVYRKGQMSLLIPNQKEPWVLNASLQVLNLDAHKEFWLDYELKELWTGNTVKKGSLDTQIGGDNLIIGHTVVGNDVELWWPVNMGQQRLYEATFSVKTDHGTYATVKKRIGFRTIVLNLHRVSEEDLKKGIRPGNNFHFEVNGKAFYAKGSNLIPMDPLWPRVDYKRYKQLIDNAIAGNQNMLRIWGGGIYMDDVFYDIADESGLLLWSEFQFSDALYPSTESFLENVRQEAVDNVRRINHHPSLALWCGNNEIEVSTLEWSISEEYPDNYTFYKKEYEKLFVDVLFPAVFENTRSISYIASSTTEGIESLDYSRKEPMVLRHKSKNSSELYHDVDWYDYTPSHVFDYTRYQVGRFANEWGTLSMPSYQAWKRAVPADQLSFNSSLVKWRNRHYPPQTDLPHNSSRSDRGLGEMTMNVEAHYPTPRKDDFVAWIAATQLFQAEYSKSIIQTYRTQSGESNRQLGTLYWQLNDQWEAPSWASLENDGRWKLAHYVTKNIFEPVIVTMLYNITGDVLDVYVASDLWTPVKGEIAFEWASWKGDGATCKLPKEAKPFTVGGLNSTHITSIKYNASLDDCQVNPRDVVLIATIHASGTPPNRDKEVYYEHTNWFARSYKDAHLVDPGLEVHYDKTNKQVAVTATKGTSAYTWLYIDGDEAVVFSENGFLLKKGQTKRITFEGDAGSWVDRLGAWSVYDLKRVM